MDNRTHLATRLAALRRDWPLRRTLLFAAGLGYAVTLAALRLPLWTAVIPAILLAVSLALRPLRRPVWLFCCGISLVFWVACVGYRSAILPLERLDGQTHTVTGWVESAPTEHGYILRVTAADGVPIGTRLLLYTTDLAAPEVYDCLTAEVSLAVLGDTQTAYRAQGIHLSAYPTGYAAGITVTGRQTPPLTHLPRLTGDRLTGILQEHLPGDEGAVLAALCLGRRSALPEAVTVAFRDSGVSHLLVVSGIHLSMVVGCVLWLFLRLGLSRRAASAVTIPVVLCFMLLVGLSAPVVRAGVMCLVWLCGRLGRKRADGMNSLGLASCLLMLANPYMAVNASFLLSFSATAGVLYLTPRLLPGMTRHTDRQSGINALLTGAHKGVVGSLAACFGALVPLLPLLNYYFGGFPLISPVTNLLAALPASCGLLLGWAGTLLCAVPGLGWLGQGALLVAGLSARLLMQITALCGTISLFLSTDTVWKRLLVTGISLLLAAGILLRSSALRRRLVVGLIVLVLLAAGIGGVLDARTSTVTVCSSGKEAALLLDTPAGEALVVTHSEQLERGAALVEEAGCTRLAFLLVMEGDSVHTAHLADLLSRVDTAGVYTLSATDWLYGSGIAATTLAEDCELTLRDLTLAVSDGGLRIAVNASTLLISDGTAQPEAADWIVYLDGLPRSPLSARQSILLYGGKRPADTLLQRLPQPCLLWPEGKIVLATAGNGDWSIQQ